MPAPARPSSRAQLDTSYHSSPAALSRSSARRYLSARSSSSGIGSSPRRIWRASAVPSSTIREYAETWSGSQASAASTRGLPVGERLPRRAVDEVEADLLEAGCARPVDDGRHPQRVVGAVEGLEHVRRRPTACRSEIRLKPAPRSSSRSQSATLSGLDSVVTSAPVGEPELRGDRRQRSRPGRPGSAASAYRRRRRPCDTGRSTSPSTPPGQPYLCDRRLGVRRPRRAGRARPSSLGGVGVEVAVAAPHRAERHVHVEPERPPAQPRQRALRQRPVRGDRITRRAARTACAHPRTTGVGSSASRRHIPAPSGGRPGAVDERTTRNDDTGASSTAWHIALRAGCPGATAQADLITRRQLNAARPRQGLRRYPARRRTLAGGEQRRPVRPRPGRCTREQLMWAGVLHAGPAAPLGGLTALERARTCSDWHARRDHRPGREVAQPRADRRRPFRRDPTTDHTLLDAPRPLPIWRVEPAALLCAGYEPVTRSAYGLLAAVRPATA